MLTLGRQSGEYVVVGEDIVIQVVGSGSQLRLAIDAPKSLHIQRGEHYEKTHPVPECIRRARERGELPKVYGFNR